MNLSKIFKKKRVRDSNVLSVIEAYERREEKGAKKYNTTTDRDDLSILEWLTHLQEELMDATIYIEKLKSAVKSNRGNPEQVIKNFEEKRKEQIQPDPHLSLPGN